ncbi:flagellar basal body P-ring protein FlgI [Candidatus Latescibacterota bacterium]
MKTVKLLIFFVIGFFMLVSAPSSVVRLKDVAQVRDQREIDLIGYSLVVGLEGTGDGKNTQFTIKSIGNMMQRNGMIVSSDRIKVKNVAAVMVTARVSPYIKNGGTFDVTVSSMGDARSLEGGTLLLTLLSGQNGKLYATAQGPISVGGTNKDFGGIGGVVTNSQLTGIVPNGGILDRELPTLGIDERRMLVTLFNPDFTTAFRLATAINESFEMYIAKAQDAGSIIVNVPGEYSDQGDLVKFISEMEIVTFRPDERARVIINERTGTIIVGGNVTISPIAIMHGNLSLSVGEEQPAAAAQLAIPGQVEQMGDRMVSFEESTNVSDVARALNLLGITPRDLIAIFQVLKRSGALRAELLVM